MVVAAGYVLHEPAHVSLVCMGGCARRLMYDRVTHVAGLTAAWIRRCH